MVERLNFEQIEALVVDADPYSTSILGQILRGFGLSRHTTIESGEEAVRRLQNGHFDLLICDAILPDINAGELIKWIRRQPVLAVKYIPIVVLTGYTQYSNVTNMRDAGANIVVRKPVAPNVLFDHIAWSARTENGTERPSDYHKVLLRRLEKLRDRLTQEAGPFESCCFVDTGPVVERVYARYAGIGWAGKNTCILNQKLGSWLFLGVIVTSLDVAPEALALPAADRCGSCTRCIDACPTGALTGERTMDANRCIAYLTIEKRGPVPEDLRSGIGRQVFGCDICQDVCPWNRRAPVATDPDLAARKELVNPALDWLAAMDESEFARRFNGSPVRRAKWAGFRRNLAIAMGNSGQTRHLDQLLAWSRDTDPVLAEAAEWAVGNLRRKECEGERL